jgi:hypothetical protein
LLGSKLVVSTSIPIYLTPGGVVYTPSDLLKLVNNDILLLIEALEYIARVDDTGAEKSYAGFPFQSECKLAVVAGIVL